MHIWISSSKKKKGMSMENTEPRDEVQGIFFAEPSL